MVTVSSLYSLKESSNPWVDFSLWCTWFPFSFHICQTKFSQMGYVVHTSSNMKTRVHFSKFSSIETSRSMQIAAWSDPKRGRWITLIRKNLLIKLIVAKPMSRNPWIFASSCLPFNQVYEYPSKPELIKPHRSKVWRLHNKHYKLIKKNPNKTSYIHSPFFWLQMIFIFRIKTYFLLVLQLYNSFSKSQTSYFNFPHQNRSKIPSCLMP